MARVVREYGRVARAEIKGTRGGVADEDGGPSMAGVEVQPFLSLGEVSWAWYVV